MIDASARCLLQLRALLAAHKSINTLFSGAQPLGKSVRVRVEENSAPFDLLRLEHRHGNTGINAVIYMVEYGLVAPVRNARLLLRLCLVQRSSWNQCSSREDPLRTVLLLLFFCVKATSALALFLTRR